MRVAIAEFSQETSSFSPVATTVDTFKLYGLYEGQTVLEKIKGVGAIGGFVAAANELGVEWTPLPLLRATAGASGIITADTLTYFEEKLVTSLEAVQPIDAFFFSLHGAGQAANVPDSEGHLLAVSRRILGDDIPIITALDHHANLTQLMVDCADGLVAHRTQPHEPFDTGKASAQMLFALLQGAIKPTVAWQKIPLITHQEQFLTSKGPMKAWFDLAREMEQRSGMDRGLHLPDATLAGRTRRGICGRSRDQRRSAPRAVSRCGTCGEHLGLARTALRHGKYRGRGGRAQGH